MKVRDARPRPERPWWRTPLQYLLRLRLRRRHVRGTLLHRLLGERLLSPSLWVPNRESAARGMAIGTFVGFLPLPGVQIFFSALLCYILRSNIAAAVIATFMSNPLTTPAILWAQYRFGVWLLPAMEYVDVDAYGTAGRYFAAYGKPVLLGSLVSSVVLGLVAYPITLAAWNLTAAGVARRRKRLRIARGESPERLRETTPGEIPPAPFEKTGGT